MSLVKTDLASSMAFCEQIAKSDMIPPTFRGKPENIMLAVQWGREVGLSPLQALQNICVINGKPSIWGDSALALIVTHPQFEDIVETWAGEGDKMVATCTIKRKGRNDIVRTFSVADAKAAGLWNKSGPWQQYKSRMLQMRARGFCIRDAFPDALRGVITVEEARDFPVGGLTIETLPTGKTKLETVSEMLGYANTKQHIVSLAKSQCLNDIMSSATPDELSEIRGLLSQSYLTMKED